MSFLVWASMNFPLICHISVIDKLWTCFAWFCHCCVHASIILHMYLSVILEVEPNPVFWVLSIIEYMCKEICGIETLMTSSRIPFTSTNVYIFYVCYSNLILFPISIALKVSVELYLFSFKNDWVILSSDGIHLLRLSSEIRLVEVNHVRQMFRLKIDNFPICFRLRRISFKVPWEDCNNRKPK